MRVEYLAGRQPSVGRDEEDAAEIAGRCRSIGLNQLTPPFVVARMVAAIADDQASWDQRRSRFCQRTVPVSTADPAGTRVGSMRRITPSRPAA